MDERDKRIQIIIEMMTHAEEHRPEFESVRQDQARFEETLAGRQRVQWEALQDGLKERQARVSRVIFHMGMAHQRTLDEERQSGIH